MQEHKTKQQKKNNKTNNVFRCQSAKRSRNHLSTENTSTPTHILYSSNSNSKLQVLSYYAVHVYMQFLLSLSLSDLILIPIAH